MRKIRYAVKTINPRIKHNKNACNCKKASLVTPYSTGGSTMRKKIKTIFKWSPNSSLLSLLFLIQHTNLSMIEPPSSTKANEGEAATEEQIQD